MSTEAVEVGVAFVSEYYNKLSQAPDELQGMYTETSVLSHHDISKQPSVHVGSAIQQYFQDTSEAAIERKYSLSSLEAHPSAGGNVLVLVRGTCLMRTQSLDFSHTFVLAKDGPSSYHVHNDCMQFKPAEQDLPAPTKQPVKSPKATPAPAPVSAPAPTPAPAPAPVKQELRSKSPVKKPEAPASNQPMSWLGIAKAKTTEVAPRVAEPQKISGGKAPALSYDRPEPEQKTEGGWVKVSNTRRPSPTRGGREPSPTRGPVSGQRGSSPQRGRSPDPRGDRGAGGAEKFKGPSLYVSKVPDTVTREELINIFKVFGEIKPSSVVKPREGYAYLDFGAAGSLKAALDQSARDGIYCKGHKLKVDERKSPEEREKQKAAAAAAAVSARQEGRGLMGRGA